MSEDESTFEDFINILDAEWIIAIDREEQIIIYRQATNGYFLYSHNDDGAEIFIPNHLISALVKAVNDRAVDVYFSQIEKRRRTMTDTNITAINEKVKKESAFI